MKIGRHVGTRMNVRDVSSGYCRFQAYAAEVVKAQSRWKGHTVTERALEDARSN